MDANSDRLGDTIRAAAPVATLTRRDELLASLTARIDAGPEDMAEAPAPGPFLAAVDGAVVAPPAPALRPSLPGRVAARAAGVGMVGWLAVAAGSAAAAAGAWYVTEHVLLPDPPPPVTTPPGTITRAEPAPAPQAQQPVEAPRAPLPPAAASAADGGGAVPPVLPDDAPHLVIVTIGDDGLAAVLDGVTGALDGVLGAADDAVDGIGEALPPGVVADTVGPVIAHVNVDGITAWAVGSLLCAIDSPVSATVTDGGGVASVSARVTTALGITRTVQLNPQGGGAWAGSLAPLSLLDLGLLDHVVHVTIEARDPAGNVTVASASAMANIGTC